MKKYVLILSILFVLFGLLFTFPLVTRFSDSMPYSRLPDSGHEISGLVQGDHLQMFYYLWLFKDAVIDKNSPLFSNPYEFHVEGVQKEINLYYIPISLPFLLMCFIFSTVVSYNLLLILTFPLTGLAMFFLAYFYVKRFWPAVISAVIFCLVPYRVGVLIGGNPNGFSFFLFPLFILFIEKIFAEKKKRFGFYAALCVFAMSQNDQHMLYYSFLILPILVLLRWIPLYINELSEERKGVLSGTISVCKRWFFLFLPFFIVTLITIGYMVYMRSTVLSVSIMNKGRNYRELMLYSPVVGEVLKMINPDTTRNVYIGILPFFLSLGGIGYGIFSQILLLQDRKLRSTTIFYTLLFLVSFILCFGPNFPGPFYKICFKCIPHFNYIRQPSKIFLLTITGVSILAGIGALRLYERKKQVWIYCILITLIIIDYYSFRPVGLSIPPRSSRVYHYIKEQYKRNETVLNIPFWPGDSSWSSLYQYSVTLYGTPMINGYTPGVPLFYYKDIFMPLEVLNLGELRYKEYMLLRKLKVGYIVLHEEAYPPKVSPYPFQFALENLQVSPYLKFIDHEDPYWLFRVRENVPPQKDAFTASSIVGMCYEGERLPRLTGRVVTDNEASGGRAVIAEEGKDKPGFLSFGPYSYNPTGEYTVVFRMKAVIPAADVASIEITTDKGNTLIKKKVLRSEDFSGSSYSDIVMAFSVTVPTEIEYRIDYSGNGTIALDYIYVLQGEQKDPLYEFDVEDLFHAGRVIDDKQADGEKAVFLQAGFDPEDLSVYGPYRRFPPGAYSVNWHIRYAGDGEEGSVARVLTTTNYGDTVIAEDVVSCNESGTQSETYFVFTQKIVLDRSSILEFLLFFTGKRDLWVDKITIQRDNT